MVVPKVKKLTAYLEKSGLPGYHPIVVSSGIDPWVVELGEQNGTKQLVEAGFNVLCRFALDYLYICLVLCY